MTGGEGSIHIFWFPFAEYSHFAYADDLDCTDYEVLECGDFDCTAYEVGWVVCVCVCVPR